MGDNCCHPTSMGAVKSEIEKALPGVYVYSVEVGNSPDADTVAGYVAPAADCGACLAPSFSPL